MYAGVQIINNTYAKVEIKQKFTGEPVKVIKNINFVMTSFREKTINPKTQNIF
jgi:hypothetical protein